MKLSRFMAVFLILCTVLMLAGGMLVTSTVAAQTFAASLIPQAGLVQYRASGSDQWKNLSETQLIRPGDQIRTGNDGMAKLNVVGGIEIDIYPTTMVELNALSLGQESGQTFILSHYVGHIFANITRTLADSDLVQVILPLAGTRVRGTQFWTFVHPQLHVAVIGQENDVEVTDAQDQVYTVDPDKFVYGVLQLPEPVPTCTTKDYLRDNSRQVFVEVPVVGTVERESAIRDFLTDFVNSNVNPIMRAFVRSFLNMEPSTLEGMTVEEDDRDLREIFSTIQTLNLTNFDLSKFLSDYRSYWASTYRSALTALFPAAVCGNLQQDPGETAENCPTDFDTLEACGNNLCETNRLDRRESVVNCPADCLPYPGFAQCALRELGGVTQPGGGEPGGGGGIPVITTTPVPVSTRTPTPSL